MSTHDEPPNRNWQKQLVALHLFGMFFGALYGFVGAVHDGLPPSAILFWTVMGALWAAVIFDIVFRLVFRRKP